MTNSTRHPFNGQTIMVSKVISDTPEWQAFVKTLHYPFEQERKPYKKEFSGPEYGIVARTEKFVHELKHIYSMHTLIKNSDPQFFENGGCFIMHDGLIKALVNLVEAGKILRGEPHRLESDLTKLYHSLMPDYFLMPRFDHVWDITDEEERTFLNSLDFLGEEGRLVHIHENNGRYQIEESIKQAHQF